MIVWCISWYNQVNQYLYIIILIDAICSELATFLLYSIIIYPYSYMNYIIVGKTEKWQLRMLKFVDLLIIFKISKLSGAIKCYSHFESNLKNN